MKTFTLFILVILLFSVNTTGQRIGDLHGINYQAVAIDMDGKEIVGMDMEGKPLYEKEIGIRFTIQSGSAGAVLYQETHTALTDQHGLFSLTIGTGNQTDGSYTHLLDIPWIDADQWLKVEMSIENNGNYRVVSLQQFMAVPYSFYTDDIADDAITTEKILNYTILNQDIDTGAVDTRIILDETIINEDIATAAVNSRTILDSTIVNKDIQTSAVDSRSILDETIINQDIADNTINLQTKVTDTLAVQNGGTGLGNIEAGDILVGSGTNIMDTLSVVDSVMVYSNQTGKTELFKLRAGLRASMEIDEATKTVYIHAVAQGGGPEKDGGTVDTGIIQSGGQKIRVFDANVALGDIVLVTANVDLEGITMTAYVRQDGKVDVVLFNGTAQDKNLGTVEFKIANFGQ